MEQIGWVVINPKTSRPVLTGSRYGGQIGKVYDTIGKARGVATQRGWGYEAVIPCFAEVAH